MLQSFITRTVDFCTRRPVPVVLVAFVLAVTCGLYVALNFAIDANVNDLLSSKLPWRQRELAYQATFPQQGKTILVVVEAPTPELTEKAADTLVQGLSGRSDIFRSAQEEGGGSFYRRNGLLFLPTDEVARTAGQLSGTEPIIRALTSDPSLRGLTEVLSIGLMGVWSGQWSLDDLAPAAEHGCGHARCRVHE